MNRTRPRTCFPSGPSKPSPISFWGPSVFGQALRGPTFRIYAAWRRMFNIMLSVSPRSFRRIHRKIRSEWSGILMSFQFASLEVLASSHGCKSNAWFLSNPSKLPKCEYYTLDRLGTAIETPLNCRCIHKLHDNLSALHSITSKPSCISVLCTWLSLDNSKPSNFTEEHRSLPSRRLSSCSDRTPQGQNDDQSDEHH